MWAASRSFRRRWLSAYGPSGTESATAKSWLTAASASAHQATRQMLRQPGLLYLLSLRESMTLLCPQSGRSEWYVYVRHNLNLDYMRQAIDHLIGNCRKI